MVKLCPFKPVIYSGGMNKSKFIAPPYDVINSPAQRELYKKDKFNVIRLILGRKYPSDGKDRNYYIRAGKYFRKWLKNGTLVKERCALYILKQEFFYQLKKYARTGIIARLDWSKTDTGQILPHEATFRKHREDRRKLLRTLPYNFSPVFLITGGVENIFKKAVKKAKRVSVYSNKDEKGSLYEVAGEDTEKITFFLRNKKFVIADGHHRFRVSRENYEKRPSEKYALVYITDFTRPSCLILSHADRKTRIPVSAIREVIAKKKLMGRKQLFSGRNCLPVF